MAAGQHGLKDAVGIALAAIGTLDVGVVEPDEHDHPCADFFPETGRAGLPHRGDARAGKHGGACWIDLISLFGASGFSPSPLNA